MYNAELRRLPVVRRPRETRSLGYMDHGSWMWVRMSMLLLCGPRKPAKRNRLTRRGDGAANLDFATWTGRLDSPVVILGNTHAGKGWDRIFFDKICCLHSARGRAGNPLREYYHVPKFVAREQRLVSGLWTPFAPMPAVISRLRWRQPGGPTPRDTIWFYLLSLRPAPTSDLKRDNDEVES